MQISLLHDPFALTIVIASLFVLVRNNPMAEHAGFVEVPPHDDVFYFLRIYPNTPLLIWLGHTPGHPINHHLNQSAIPPFDRPISILMIDLPGIGRTKSARSISVDSLTIFLRLAVDRVKSQYQNYSANFREIWIGGEKYMTPLAVSLAGSLSQSYQGRVGGLILGNPYLAPRLSMPRRFPIVKHFGYLDIEKEEQFGFLNDLCMKNTSLSGCSRSDKLFDIVTNKSEHLTAWSESYLTSVLSRPNYLQTLVNLLKSRRYKVLLYAGQLDLNSGFQRVFSTLQHFAVCSQPSPLTFYAVDNAVKGFFIQNECWSLIQLYNSSANVTHLRGDVLSDAIERFMSGGGKLQCTGTKCDMQGEIARAMPNCSVDDWTTGEYHCSCDNGKYGVNCSVEVPAKGELENYNAFLAENEVTYAKFVVTGKGALRLTSNKKNCTIDVYANLYQSDAESLEIPNAAKHDIHTTKGKIVFSSSEPVKAMIKLVSQCEGVVEVSLVYQKEKPANVGMYMVLTAVLGAVMVVLGVSMALVWKKIGCRKSPTAPLLESVASS